MHLLKRQQVETPPTKDKPTSTVCEQDPQQKPGATIQLLKQAIKSNKDSHAPLERGAGGSKNEGGSLSRGIGRIEQRQSTAKNSRVLLLDGPLSSQKLPVQETGKVARKLLVMTLLFLPARTETSVIHYTVFLCIRGR